jgi:hypothetical protein
MGALPKEWYSFARTWLHQLPTKPKEAADLLTALEMEEEGAAASPWQARGTQGACTCPADRRSLVGKGG